MISTGRSEILILALILVATGCAKEKEKKPVAQPVAVAVAEVTTRTIPIEIRTFGTVDASASVAVKAQIGGVLTQVHFREGQDVKQGDPLLSIDARPAEAAVKQAEANLARDTVQQKNAEIEAGRQEELFKKGLTSQDVRDLARMTAEALSATIKGDQAAVERARLEREYCSITAPISGRTGRLMLDVGNVIKANEGVLVTLNQIQPVYISFALTQNDLPAVRQRLAEQPLPVRVVIPGEAGKTEDGLLTFVDNAVDKSTGTVQARATFTNANTRLWPGQFVSVVLTVAMQKDAILVPSSSVQTSQKGTYVFVVKSDLTAENRPVTAARIFNDETVIADGLSPGERIVTEGQFRLGPGAKVSVKSAAPKPPANPP